MGKKYRIGIDVGGTFTDAALIDNETFELVAKLKIPTTHYAAEGVASGIIQVVQRIMKENDVAPADVVFIAHGTTQATNALLEGDVASVGIVGMGKGIDAVSARNETNIPSIELSPKKNLICTSLFLDSSVLDEAKVKEVIQDLHARGAEVIVAAETYSVDNPKNEDYVVEVANKSGILATASHEISQLYGLKVRARTAVINGSLLPKMIETANMTEQAVIDSGIKTKLMIMRCDGGVMNVDEVRKRPILTMLSGLAAGVAGALMYEKVSDGIFFEVGGTSVDISVIKNGKVMVQNAQVGGHKTYLRSLDVRTLGLAGGSMLRFEDKRLIDVGPRSAHVAELEYECFTDAENMKNPKVEFVSPRKGDPDYAVVSCCGKTYSYTLAGAANLLGYVPADDYAYANQESTRIAWESLGEYLNLTAEEVAKRVIKIATDKVMNVVNDLIREYQLDKSFVVLVGGGGSASVLVPALANLNGFDYKIAKNAPYISTIGVALALISETIERNVNNPTEEDIKHIRAEIIEKMLKLGANEHTIDVTIEIDSQRNILRATAFGATEFRAKDLTAKSLTKEERMKIAMQALNVEDADINSVCQSGRWEMFESVVVQKKLFGMIKSKQNQICVLDREGVVRFRRKNCHGIMFKKKNTETIFSDFIDEYTTYSEANASIPSVIVFYGERFLDLTSIPSKAQLFSLLALETEHMSEDTEIIAVAY